VKKTNKRRSLVRLAIYIALATLAIGPLAYSTSGNRIKSFFSLKSSQSRGATRGGGQSGAVAQSSITPDTVSQIVALEAEKTSRTPNQMKIDSQLLQAVKTSRGEQMAAGVNLEAIDTHADDAGAVLIDIDATVSDALVTDLETMGVTVIYPSFEYNTIRAKADLSQMELIAGLADVKFVQLAVRSITSGMPGKNRPAGPVIAPNHTVLGGNRPSFAERAANVRQQLTKALAKSAVAAPFFTGTINSQGDRAHRADDLRNTFGYSGSGVRIGVLSDSFNNQGGAAADVASGNLPGPGNPLGNLTPVTVVQDIASAGSDEGRAMLQIVHDLAPKAQLFFATADVSEAGFAANIQALRNAPNNCDIIIDDVFYFDESPFQDGIVAQAVNTVTTAGALYFSSAGNEGNVTKNTAGYFEGDFDDTGSPAFTFPGGTKTGTIHNFSGTNGDIITAAGQAYTLNWADPAGAATDDYDLFLVSSTGTVKASSTNIQNGTQNPFEQINAPALASGDRLVVFKTAASAKVAFAINTIRGTLTINTTGQTHGHSAAVNAFSVAATPAAAAFNGVAPVGPFPSSFIGTNNVESFTSDGPRRVFFNANGTAITPGNVKFGTNGGAVRNKPDITAADGVSTTLASNSGLNPFYGTSAAAPHAGAIAGLLLSGNRSLTPAQIRTILTTTALDIEGAGYDNISGFGIVQAFQAMQAVSPSPQADVNLGTVTTTDGTFSNHNGILDPGENGNVVVQLTNPSLLTATNVSATLASSTPGLTIDTGTASYGTIDASGSATNAGSAFVVSVSSLVPCGTVINFTLTVTFTGANSPQVFLFTVKVGNTVPVISSTLGSAPPTIAGVTSITGTQTGRLSRNAPVSACGSQKTTPILTATTGARAFDAYTFTNSNAASQCVTVTMTAPNGINMYVAAYNNGGFVPATPNTNYLADQGSSAATQTFSFDAPAGQNFTIVVHEVNPGGAVGSSYNLSVSLANCAAGPECTPVTITTNSIATGSTGVAYSQAFSATGGSGNYTFALTAGTLPGGLSLTGNTISGTPTQAGTFPITITASDNAGCPSGSQNYNLVINGVAPASITATAGGGQTVLPSKVFPTTFKATVRDGSNNLMPGVNVTFTAPGAGASGTFPGNALTANVITDANGVATAPTFTANNTSGTYNVTATVVGVANPATFSLTNASCTTYTVTSSADSGPGTLRDILTSTCSGTTITFAGNLTAGFTPQASQINLSSELPITTAMTITGPGADQMTISGSNLSRIFNISAGANTVSISGLTLRDGKPVGGSTGGGAILINNGAAAGAVNLTGVVITNNDASLAGNPLGGGIDNEGGTVTISRSSIVNNTSTFRGGGIQNQGFGSMVITDSTIAGNTAGTAGIGGGIRSLLNLTLTNDTFFGNSAQTAGNISRSGGTITFKNTIIAGGTLIGSGGTGPDISGAGFTSADFNLIQNTATGTITGTTTHNITGVSPNLLPLANYGGPTPTLLPGPTSPVINKGDTGLVSGTDQRGLPRVVAGEADMGSVESNFTISVVSGSPQATPINTNFPLPLVANVKESGVNQPGISVQFLSQTGPPSATFNGSLSATVNTDVNGNATSPTATASGAVGFLSVTASIGTSIPPAIFNLSNQGSVVVTVGSSVNPSTFGQTVTFTANVAPSGGVSAVPGGTIQFKDGANNIGTPIGLSGGSASFAINTLTAGTHTITAVYSGDPLFLPATSLGQIQTVNKGNTTISNPISGTNPAIFTQTVTFSATVTVTPPGLIPATGTVNFMEGGNVVASGTLSNGTVNASTTSLSVGSHIITAVYLGDGNLNGSTSPGSLTQVINKVNTSLTGPGATVNPTVFGQSVTFSTTINVAQGGFGTPTGTVQFKDGAANLGAAVTVVSGSASITVNTLSVGSHSISAVYSGDGQFNGSTSVTQTQVVNQASTSTAVATSVVPSFPGQSVTFTATATAVAPGAGTPTGTVTFKDGANTLGTSPLNGSAVATFSTAALSVGQHVITATYNGDGSFLASTGNLSGGQNVVKGTTTNTASSTPNPSVFGQSVTITATVAPVAPAVTIPTGTVEFHDDGLATLATATLNGSGQATFTTSNLSVGTHPLFIVYQGDVNYNGGGGALNNQVVNQASTTTTIASSANPSQFGQTVTFTATVTAVAPGAGLPTGTVTFTDGGNTIGTGTLNGAGQATFATNTLSVATHSIVASYGGDTNFLTSTSAALSQVVNKAQTATAVTSSVNPSVFGQSVTFTATVTSAAPAAIAPPSSSSSARRVSTRVTSTTARPAVGAGTPTGTVTFMDGATTLGTGTLNGSAQATFSTSALAVGSHSITIVYGGDGNFLTSTSPALTQTVNKANTTTATVTSSANPSAFGQSVTFTTTVAAAAPGAGTPTGTVTFSDGATTLGTGTLNGSGVATFTTAALAVGSHSITASYGGDGNFNASTTANALTQVVNKALTTTVLTTNAAPEFPGGPQVAFVGGTVTITATVTAVAPGAGTPTGTVQFKDNGVNIGGPVALVAGKASVTETKLTPGTHTVTATYSGDGNFVGSSATLTGGLIVGFQFKDDSNGNVLIVTVPANGSSGNGTYTFLSGSTVIVSNVPALIEFNSNELRIRTNSPSLNALFDATTNIGQALLFDPTRNQSFVINSTHFVLVP